MFHFGCSKNLIDTEVAIGHFKIHKYNVVNDPKEADIIVVNTCGFIDSAKKEAINTILEMAEYKKKRCRFLIVMGCLVQRYYSDLIKELPEVDLFIKLDEYNNFWKKIDYLVRKNKVEISNHKSNIKISEVKKMPMPKMNEFIERVVTTGKNYAYLKIGEGCSNNCTYCAIPYIRGPFVSRPIEDIIEEAKILANKGIKELIIIAQDTTKYGIDIYGESKLAELLTKLSKIKEIKWIRFLYSYPEGITDELIETVAKNEKICKYFDIPIQHISNKVLKRMNRRTKKEDIELLIQKIRNKIPNVILRTSLIVGFPGETEEQFEELYEFIEKTKFDRLGVFEYSKEEGTPAAKLSDQIHHSTKRARFNKIMKKQQEISNQLMSKKVGQVQEVLIEDIYPKDDRYFIGRTKNDVPDIDGIIYIKNEKEFNKASMINTFIECEIIDYLEYDLFGKIIKERLPLVWIGIVGVKNLYATWNEKHNQIRYIMNGQEIAVYDLDVMDYMEDPIVFKNDTIVNNLSAEAKDKIQQLSRNINIKMLKEYNKTYNKEYQNIIAKELGIQSYNLVGITEIDLKQKIKNNNIENKKKKQDDKNKIRYKEKIATKKDIKIKQELKTDAMATSMKTIGQVLQRAGKMPKTPGKKFTKLGIVESDSIKDIDKNNKTNTTRFSFIAIANDGTVVPLNLEQDHQEGNNPREISHRVNADGRVEQDDVNSRYRIGNSGETISIKFSNGPGNIEVGYSAHKTLGGEEIEGDVSIDHQLQTSSVYWKPRTDSREREYADGTYGTENREKEVIKEGNHEEELKRGKKGSAGDDTHKYKDVDGDEKTKDSHHEFDLIERARKLINENEEVADTFTEEEVIKMLEKAHDNGSEIEKAEEDIKEDAERVPGHLK